MKNTSQKSMHIHFMLILIQTEVLWLLIDCSENTRMNGPMNSINS